MTHRLLVGLLPAILLLPIHPAVAFSRVPQSLNSDSERAQPVIPDNKKKAAPRPRHVYVAPPVDPMKEIRKRMVAGSKVTSKELRTLAESGDDLAAYNYAKRMEEAGDPESLATSARFYLKALNMGREVAIRPLIRVLKAGALDQSPKNLASAKKTLDGLADKGNIFARDGMLEMYQLGTPFGPDADRVAQLVAAKAKSGDTQAALDLAVALLTGTPDADDREQAREYLEIAATSETLNVRTIAENLLRGLDPQAELTVATETHQ